MADPSRSTCLRPGPHAPSLDVLKPASAPPLPRSYPFHFHLSGDVGNNSYLTDNSVYNSWWRCEWVPCRWVPVWDQPV